MVEWQKGIAEKLLPQLERLIMTKLEISISRQLQGQFQTVGKQALQVRCLLDGGAWVGRGVVGGWCGAGAGAGVGAGE